MKRVRKLQGFLFFVVCFVVIFSVTSCFYKTAPNGISCVSPGNTASVFSNEVTFEWKLGNFASGVTYDFYFGDSEDDLQLIEANITNNKFSRDSLTKFKTYYWKIVAKNEYGEAESAVYSFMLCDEYPRDPSPENDTTNQPTDTVLSWECCCPEGSTLTYDIYLGDGGIPYLAVEGCTTKSYDPGELNTGTTYYWKVVAKDGEEKYESEIWNFKTIEDPENAPPDEPVLTNPVNNAINQPVDITLEWNCTDPDGDTLSFDLYFGKNADPQFYMNDIESSTFNIEGLDKGTTYYWKVMAKDGRGGRTCSETYNFKTIEDPNNNPPTEPSTPTPLNDATDQPTDTTLSWECSDPDGDSLAYDVYFGNNANPPLVNFEQGTGSYDPGELNMGTTYYWKILAKDGRGGRTCSATYNFKTIEDPDNNPPTEPGTPTPLNDATDQSTDTILSWECSDPDGDTLKYDVYFGDNTNPSLVNFEQEVATYDPGELNTGTTYYWKIVAKDGRGGVTAGAKWSFETIEDPENTPPATPNLTSPTDDSTDNAVDITLEWNCTDPDGDTLTYDLYFGKNTEPQFYINNINANTFNIDSLDNGTEYYWKILAKDGRGGRTSSGICNFKTGEDSDNNPPTEPGTPTPLNEATDRPTDTTLSWECSDPDGDTLKYDVYFGDNSNPSLVNFEQEAVTYDPGELNTGTTYYWKIVAKDGRGGVTTGAKWEFETIPDPENTPPATPSLTSPTDDSTDNAVDITLEWNCTDPDGDTLTYDLYFGKNTDPQFYMNDINANTFNMNGLDSGTIYYWKILAKDGRGGRTSSGICNFKTGEDSDNNPPTEPGTPTPLNEATDRPTDTTLSWECSDPDGDTLKYDVYFGDNPNPSLVNFEQEAATYDPGELNAGTTYYWKILAKDGRGGATEGSKWEFETIPDPENTPPATPNLTSPTDESTDNAIDVTLEWNCTDPDGDTLTYDLYFGKNVEPQFYTNDIEADTFNIEGLDKGTEYYWKVMAKDRRGGKTYSEIYNFKTVEDPDNNPPTEPSTPTPLNNATDQPTDTTLSWECSDPDGDTLKYDVYFGDNSNPSLVSNEQIGNDYDPGELNAGTTYYWKIVAKDGRGGATEGVKWEFETIPDPENTPPATPNLTSPTDGSADNAVDITLEWNCIDPDGDTLTYDLYFGKNVEPQFYTNDIDANTFNMNGLDSGTIYYWKILAKDGRGGRTLSGICNFKTGEDSDNNPPTEPSTPTPLNNATDQPTDTTLSWECSDPDGDTLKYDVYFGDNSNPSLVSNEQIGNDYDPGELNAGTTYYWKIVAKDGRGGATEGAKWNFEIAQGGSANIPEPINPSPTDNSTGVLWNGVTLSWEVSGNSEGLYYDIYFGKAEVPGIYRIGYDATEIVIPDLDRGEIYYWQIVVTDEPYSRENDTGASNEKMEEEAIKRKERAAAAGEIWNFTTKENSAPILYSMYPTNGEVDVSISSELTWYAFDSDEDKLEYDIYFGNTPNPPLVSFEEESNIYAPEGMCGGATTYYWKIVAKDDRGGKYESGTLKFTTKMIQWQKCLGGSGSDYANSIQQTEDGGYIVAGYTSSTNGDVSDNNGGNDYWVVRLDEDGSIIWQKCLGGSGTDYAKSIQQTADGGYIVAGDTYSSDGDVSKNNGKGDYWVVRLDEDGSIIWQNSFGGSENDMVNSVAQTSDGGYIVAGYTSSTDGDVSDNNGGNDCWIVKLTDEGSMTWQKCFGGTKNDYAASIQQTSDGGYIVAGITYSTNGDVSGNHGGSDYWIVKLTDEGSMTWQKCFGGTGSESASSIQQTSDGGYIVTGYTSSNNGDVSGDNHGGWDYWMVKLTDEGSITWRKCFGGNDTDYGNSVEQTSDGGYIVAGYTRSQNGGDVSGKIGGDDYWIVKLTSDGSMTWQKCFGGYNNDQAYSIQQTSDGEYIVAGYTKSINRDVSGNHGSTDYWVVKFTPGDE